MNRFVKFCFVGASGVIVDMAILYLLADKNMLAWKITPSKIAATETAIINNFIWNDLWTFRDVSKANQGTTARFIRLGKFNAICLAGMLINVILLNIQIRHGINLYLANLVSIALVTIWNFTMNSKFGWMVNRKGA